MLYGTVKFVGLRSDNTKEYSCIVENMHGRTSYFTVVLSGTYDDEVAEVQRRIRELHNEKVSFEACPETSGKKVFSKCGLFGSKTPGDCPVFESV